MPGATSGPVVRAIKATYKIIIVDALVLVALYYVFQDLQWRTSYAASLHTACYPACGYSPSFGYGLLTRVFTMDGNNQHLVSPITFDWVQGLILVLVVVNAWFAWSVLRSRSSLGAAAAAELRASAGGS